MSKDALGILIGTIAAIVVTPFVAALWRRLAPPGSSRVSEMSMEAWRRSQAFATEALVVTALLGVLLGSYLGFASPADFVVVLLVIGGLFAVPTAWILLRIRFHGRTALQDFIQYFEAEHHFSFKSWMYVSVPAMLITVGCLVAVLLRR